MNQYPAKRKEAILRQIMPPVEQAGIGPGEGEWHLGTDTLYLATKSTVSGSAGAGEWKARRCVVVGRHISTSNPVRGRLTKYQCAMRLHSGPTIAETAA
jgi:hypothetical protein